jgi:trigger factor
VEIRPKITLANYAGIKLTRQAISVTDQNVDKALTQLQHQHSQLESHETGHGIQAGDYVIMDFEGFAEGVPLTETKAEGFLLEVGSKTLPSEIEDGLIGRKSGESFEIDLTLPQDHQNKQWAGKEILFKIKIHEVKRKVLPLLDDDFAKELGVNSLEELRKKLQTEIENRLRSERTAQEKEQLVKQLIAQHTFQVPPSMVERELQDIVYRLRNQGRFAGSTAQDAALDLKAIQEEYRPIAEDRARGRILLQSIAEREGLSVEQQEVEQELALMAKGMRTTAQEVKNWILSQQGSLEGLKTKLLERKALEVIHSKAIFDER